MFYSELKCKEVINVRNCKRLGRVVDFEFDDCNGGVCTITVSEGGRWLSFWKEECEYQIPWKCIRQIGPDIILVDIV